MNKSIKKWFKFDSMYSKFIKYSGAGDALYETSEPVKVLITGEIVSITTLDGKEYVSRYVVYVDAEDIPEIKVNDKLVVMGTTYPVKQSRIVPNKFGQIDVWVVIL